MAFVQCPSTSLPLRPANRLRVCNARRQKPHAPATRRPTMIDQNAVAIVATMVAGIGGGIALVAWTETQGTRTKQRQNTQPCTECGGQTTTVCNVCNGSSKDPLNDARPCSYCDGVGNIKCFNCSGSGIQPRFLDRLSPEDFMD